MSNKVKDTLHELIRYMSKSEKRYFKIMSSRHTIGDENNYTVLFDFIEHQKEYDEAALFKHFKGQAFLNKFSITKKRLYDHIINALDNYHSNNSVDAQIYRLLNGAEILYQKSLYSQSFKQLKSAEKLAQKHHKYNLLSEISLKMKRVYESQGIQESDLLQDMLLRDLDFHRKSLTYDKMWNLKGRLFSLLGSKGISRTEEDLHQFKGLIDELMLAADPEDLFFDSLYLQNHIYSAYFFAIADFQACFSYLMQNLTLLEETPLAIQDHPNRYLSVLTNAMYVAFRLEKQQDLRLLQLKLKTLANEPALSSNEDLQIKLFSSIHSIELTMLMMQGKLSDALELVPVIENGLLLYDDKITPSRKAFLNFKIASIYFARQDFHAALRWINKILNDTHLDRQEDIVSFAHLLSLLIHFEMKNDSIIQYVLRNTQRYLKSRNRLYDFENRFLRFINKMSKKSNEIEREELWAELFHELSATQDDQLKRVAFEYFDFITWAEAKACRQSFEDLTRRKVVAA